MKILVLMTCHNRVESTMRSIHSAERSSSHAGIELNWSIVDDGSNDGTSEAILRSGIKVLLTKGDGNLYWNGGMALAWETGRRAYKDFNYVLWLNDDVILDVNCLAILSKELIASDANIISGSCRGYSDRASITYGGYRKCKELAFKLERVIPEGIIKKIDTFNGNLVLMEVATIMNLGFRKFTHSYGDIDFGVRAKLSGYSIILASVATASCDVNNNIYPWLNPEMTLIKKIEIFISPKGFPFKEHLMFYEPLFGKIFGPVAGTISWSRHIFKIIWMTWKSSR